MMNSISLKKTMAGQIVDSCLIFRFVQQWLESSLYNGKAGLDSWAGPMDSVHKSMSPILLFHYTICITELVPDS